MDFAPKLRDVEAFPVEHQGQRCIALRDPAGYTDAVVLLPPVLLEIVSLFDGRHSMAEIQAALGRRFGEPMPREPIERAARSLDEHGFLDSAGFASRRTAIDAAFLARPTRPAAHAGGAYPGAAADVHAAFDALFTAPDGPGPVDGASSGATAVRGVIAPHIDFQRGGPAYAWAYRDVAERSDADLFVIFGTCHAGMAHPFALTGKDYESPLGPVAVDRAFVESLAARARQDCFGAELAHRVEHSIEFQAVFLRYLFDGRRDIAIVPVLASFAHEALARGRRPEDDPRVPRFLDALAETIAASGRRVALVAGADLAHVGPRFGDPEPVTPLELARIADEDRAMLAAVEAGDPAAFFESVAGDDDRRRICGLSPIWMLLAALGGGRGELKRYAQWPDPQGVVTFASVIY
ncbi:MAG: AmmeMemoRadiSam system protein B [Candidatus Rokubacteria bacterium]|nr:AmmeMemoRadiSam system protein B [Candidatus Rokubacteria bacterium]